MQLYDPETNQWYDTKASQWGDDVASTLTPITQAAPTGGTNLVSPSEGASDMASKVLSAQFGNWKQQFQPLELNLLNQSSINNPQVLTNAVDKASNTAAQTYDTMSGVERRSLSAQGVVPTDAQEQVSNRIRNLSKAAAVAGAENKARQQVAYNDELIALGSAPNPQLGKKV